MGLKKRIASVAVLGAVAAAVLSGCGQAPSTALQVGDRTISMSELDESTQACLAAFPNDPEGDVRPVVANGLYGAAIADVLGASGTTIPDADVNASLDSLGATNLDATCRTALKGVLEARLLSEKLGADKTAELLKDVQVTVNPAIGDVNSTKTEVVARSGSLSSVGRVFGSTTGQ